MICRYLPSICVPVVVDRVEVVVGADFRICPNVSSSALVVPERHVVQRGGLRAMSAGVNVASPEMLRSFDAVEREGRTRASMECGMNGASRTCSFGDCYRRCEVNRQRLRPTAKRRRYAAQQPPPKG